MAVVFDWSLEVPKIVELEKRGAKIVGRPRPTATSRWSRIRKRLHKNVLPGWLERLIEFKPEVVCISSGNTYEWMEEGTFIETLAEEEIPYVPVCQLNSSQRFLNDAGRRKALSFFNGANKVVFVSEQNKLLAERQLAASVGKGVVVCNPVNLNDRRAVQWPESSRIVFANVARLQVKYKAQDILFEALAESQWQTREWELRMFGEGPDREFLQQLADYYGIAGKIKFEGHVKDIRKLWSECHMLLLPSHAEGTPLALLEAMLLGRPSVVTDVGGNSEWIEDRVTGFLAEGVTTASIGRALETAWETRDEWERMGMKARQVAQERQDPTPGKTLLDILKNCVQ